jgi:glucan biosynthesis protein C
MHSNRAKRVMWSRCERILVPLLTVFFFVNTLQLLVMRFITADSSPLPSYFAASFASGAWLSHLWFLVYLFGYITVLRAASGTLDKVPDGLVCKMMPIVAIAAPLLVLGTRIAAKLMPVLASAYAGLSAIEWFDYFWYYFVGFLLATRPLSFTMFNKWTALQTATCIAAVLGLMWSYRTNDMPARIVQAYTTHVVAWCGVLGCVRVFSRVLSSPSNTMRRIADSAYSIYLLHHLIVLVTGYLMTQVQLPLAFEVAIVFLVGTGLPLCAHVMIKRVPALLYFLNGSRSPERQLSGLERPARHFVQRASL